MVQNPLLGVETYGQSIWLDFLRRSALENGQIRDLIDKDGVSGLTSNPSIFEKAIAGSHDYDNDIRSMSLEGKEISKIYQALTIDDIRHAADLFRPVYEREKARDGFVSLEVSPKLAHDTSGTISEARRLWAAVDRPNLLIKVPGTKAGLPAIQQLIGEGINVNVTLLFGLNRYRQVAEAYLAGLEALADSRKPLDQIASVASFFLSRIDVLIDPMLEKMRLSGDTDAQKVAGLHGQVAVASAKVAYQIYQEIFKDVRFQKLARMGARPQRLLWASTSTKNPEYSDIKYVEALIGQETVNTIPMETLNAYRDHGQPASRLKEEVQQAYQVLDKLEQAGFDLEALTQQLEDEGVEKFSQAFEKLMNALKDKRAVSLKERVDRQVFHMEKYEKNFHARLDELKKKNFVPRLWKKEPGLWDETPEVQKNIRNSLGWLHVAEKMEESLRELHAFRKEVLQSGFKHVLHMGMGGSSLTPLVFERTFKQVPQGLPLTVLDSTDPETILHIENSLPLQDTLFIVASKSGTTAEPLAFGEYFYEKVRQIKGDQAGKNFCVITDPGTPLVKTAEERSYRKTFLNFADIGGRYSALSYFGLVPAVLMGVDVDELLERALRMRHACAASVPPEENPGLLLGAALGELARDHHRDKVTFLVPDSISSLGMWLEQLLAESTGKHGTGLLPIAGEPLGNIDLYGDDRIFVHIRIKGENDQAREDQSTALKKAGHPVISIILNDKLDLGEEFFRWEFATAIAGSILGINPFDQPNVQESKDNTNRLLELVRKQGNLPAETPSKTQEPLSLYFKETAPDVSGTLKRFLSQAHLGDYVALMAYIPETPASEKTLQDIRRILQQRMRVATTLGYGPRFLHSTGQFHKGGPATGLFLQLTVSDPKDVRIPGAPYTFGTFKRAQALGDLEALKKHGRRVGRVDLGSDANLGLSAFKAILESL
jgi:transaldolase/glucose-6-phosphate isomerase